MREERIFTVTNGVKGICWNECRDFTFLFSPLEKNYDLNEILENKCSPAIWMTLTPTEYMKIMDIVIKSMGEMSDEFLRRRTDNLSITYTVSIKVLFRW